MNSFRGYKDDIIAALCMISSVALSYFSLRDIYWYEKVNWYPHRNMYMEYKYCSIYYSVKKIE